MNVHQLIQELAGYDGQTEVLVSIDPEGNGFRKLSELGLYFVAPGDRYYIEDLYSPADLLDEGEDPEDYEPRVVLWP